ncbi:MAG: hypothetical protein JRJ12_13090 [Deltaproteobacteria bacterium]|nr:hypothetical protein [Deltaproteobacteria bacterium]MBW2072126.1 hypothetical protein [Deltaproteobacteria bacterium]
MSDIQLKLRRFFVHDLRRNPILGLYLVVGGIVVGYLCYFLVLMARDLSSGANRTQVASVAKERPGKAEAGVNRRKSQAEARSSRKKAEGREEKAQSTAVGPSGQQVAAVRPNSKEAVARLPAAGVDTSNWRRFDFPDSSHITYPPDWQESDIPSQEKMLYGIRFKVPHMDASIQLYSRSKDMADDLARTLQLTMRQSGGQNIASRQREINNFVVTEIEGTLADKHMVISIFDQNPKSYFIASLIAVEPQYKELKKYYDALLASYSFGKKGTAVSLEDIEQSIRQGIQKQKESLIGKMVEITLDSGKKQKGVVIAEDSTSYVLENYRFGGRYSFTVEKEHIIKISH